MANNGQASRLRTTVRDMFLSMLLIVVPLMIVLWLMPSNTPKTPVNVVSAADYQQMLTTARSELPFTALSPTGLPSSWLLTSDEYQPLGGDAPAEWRLGYQTTSGKYATFWQTTESVAQFLSDQHSDATQTGTVTIDGVTWQKYQGTTPGGLPTLLFREVQATATSLPAQSAAADQTPAPSQTATPGQTAAAGQTSQSTQAGQSVPGTGSLEIVGGSAPLSELQTLVASLRG